MTNSYFIETSNYPSFQPFEGVVIKVLSGLHGEKMMMALTTINGGRTVPTHAHPHEQIGTVQSGRGRFTIGEEVHEVQQGDFFRIPPDIPHKVECLGDKALVVIDVFCPVREDFLERVKSLNKN